MMIRLSHIGIILVLTACLFAGCGGGGKKCGGDAPVGLTKSQQDELSAKYRSETKKKITKDNAEKVLKDLEAEIVADPDQ